MVVGVEAPSIPGTMSACDEFAQHVWKKDLCKNCQRPKNEHPDTDKDQSGSDSKYSDSGGTGSGPGSVLSGQMSVSVIETGSSSPKPAKRNSLMTKSWTAHHGEGLKSDENDDDQWDLMCQPDSKDPNKRLDDIDQRLSKQTSDPDQKNVQLPPEHSYEDIDWDDLKTSQRSSVEKSKLGNSGANNDATVTVTANKTTISLNPEERLSSLVNKSENVSPSNKNLNSRSRSTSRERSPGLGLKPKIGEKPSILDKKLSQSDFKSGESQSQDQGSPKENKKLKKERKSISFIEKDPSVIGDDGGLDNLYSDHEDNVSQSENEPNEKFELTETEKEWALQALRNRLWNSETAFDGSDSSTDRKHPMSKEFEDLKMDGDTESHNFGTFPLRTKSEKSAIDNMFTSNRLSTLTESSENLSDLDDKYESVLKFIGADKLAKLDFNSSPKHKGAIGKEGEAENSYDDPWNDKFAFETDSEMNLLDEIKGEIDLDSSSAGFALVDLLNDVLAKYSTGAPSETDSLKNFDGLDDEKGERRERTPREKSADIEAKIVHMAANLRKQRAKGRAPRPPSHPPEPPQDNTKSPAKQAELRAAQSKEPTFKMVPLGKTIGTTPLEAQEKGMAMSKAGLSGSQKSEIGSTSSSNSSEVDLSKYKNDKQAKKSSGGIGGFFSRIFGGRKDSDSDITASNDTLVQMPGTMSDPYTEAQPQGTDIDANVRLETGKDVKVTGSPKLKPRETPARSVSPKPVERMEAEKSSTSSQQQSPKPEINAKTKDNVKAEKSEKNASQKNSIPPTSVSGASPTPSKTMTIPITPTKEDKDKNEVKATSPKTKEAPPLPLNPPRDVSDHSGAPKPRARGNSEGGVQRSRPRNRDIPDGKPSVPPPKPPVAMKPRPVSTTANSVDNADKNSQLGPINSTAGAINNSSVSINSNTSQFASTTSLDNARKPDEPGKKPDRPPDPKVLRKRAKSPKRFIAPAVPAATRSSNTNITDSNVSLASTTSETSVQNAPTSQNQTQSESEQPQPKPLAFAKELERKLNKEQHAATLPADARKMSAPPPPPTSVKHDSLEKSKSLPGDHSNVAQQQKFNTLPSDASRVKEKENVRSASPKSQRSRSSSKDDLKTSPAAVEIQSKTLTNQNSSASLQTESEAMVTPHSSEIPIHSEKIELPKPAGNSRKSFLGKLNRNKNKQQAQSSVKRTKSITEQSFAADHQLKKIDLKDISGPVLITDMSSSKVVNRRNTITIGGDGDNSFLSGGSTSSGSTSAGEKSDLSPRGSVENMYEFITSDAPTPPTSVERRNFYDHVVEGSLVIGLRPPSMTGSEGYLEPVRSNQIHSEQVNTTMAESQTSQASMTTSFITSLATNMADGGHMTQSTNEIAPDNPYGVNNSQNTGCTASERDALIASQPIYEEITNGYGRLESSGVLFYDENVTVNTNNSATDVHQQNAASTQLPSSLKKKDSFSSESELSSTNSSLSRPRPIPRRRPRPIGSGFEQYVAMNKPGVSVYLNEQEIREMLGQLSSMNLNTIREIYTQHDKCFTKGNLHIGSVGPLKWSDFDIYGKAIHTSDKSIVYNAKMKATMSACQVMLLHSRPEITAANHPSLLKPTCIFTDSVPFTYLTDEFIKTSEILETCVTQTHMAKCYIVVGLFDVSESLAQHMGSLEMVCENQRDFLRKVLFFVLQILSAISHCLEEGHPLSEGDFHDLFLISNPYCLGETVAFLPQVRSPNDQRIDRVCFFIEKFLTDMCSKCDASKVLDDDAYNTYTGIQKIMDLLEAGVLECLPIVRNYIEFLLWGPGENHPDFSDDQQSSLEPKLSMWLEKERAALIHDFAKRVQKGTRCNIRDFYRMKFLLKASPGTLLECIRCHAAASETSR